MVGIPVNACVRLNAGNCMGGNGSASTGNGSTSNTAGSVVPSVIGDAHANVVRSPVDACLRVNAGGCGNAADPGSGTSPGSTGAPVIAGDAQATVSRVADAVICLRVNGGACGTGSRGAAGSTASLVPSVIGDVAADVADIPVSACLRLNAGDCGNGTDRVTGGDANPILPTIGSGLTVTAGDLVDAVGCVRINGGSCGATAGGSDGTGPGGGSGGTGATDPTGGSDGTGSGGRTDRGGSDPNRFGRLGIAADRPTGDGSVKGIVQNAAPVATVPTTIRFLGGIVGGQLFGGQVLPVTSQPAVDPAGRASDQLAHTGSSAAMLPLLIGGLLALLLAGPLLTGRRRS